MVAILNDAGLSLQLTPGTSLVTEQAVAWLSDDELPAEYSYPLEAPLNEHNQRFVGFSYRPDAARPSAQLPVTVRLDGVLYRRCSFSFRVNEGKLSGYLKIDASEFYDQIRHLSLLEALSTPIPLGDGLTSTPPVSLQTRLGQIARLTPGQFPCTFFPLRNEAMLEADFSTTQLPGFTRRPYVNNWGKLEDGTDGFTVDLPNKPDYGSLICPQFYLAYVLKCLITDLAGYQIESDWLASAEVQALTIKNLTAMAVHQASLGELIAGHSLVPGLFLPDMSVGDFLIAIKSRFGLVFAYNANRRVCRISQFVRQIAKPATIDLTPFQIGSYSTQPASDKGITLSEYIDSADELYRDSTGNTLQPASQVLGKGGTSISLKVGTCQLAYESSPLGENTYWFVPTVHQAGNVLDPAYKRSNNYLTKEGKRPNTTGLCLLTYRGLTTDSGGHAYPLASPDVRDGQQVVVGSQALGLGGQWGSWRSYLQAYFYFRDQTQPITQRLLLPVSILATLELDGTVALSLNDHIRRSYLISKVSAESPGPDGKATVSLEVLNLPPGLDLPTTSADPTVWVEYTAGNWVFIDAGNGYRSLSVKLWQDQAKTRPALVTNLPIQIRVKKSLYSTVLEPSLQTYSEYVLTYYANGTSTVLDPAFVFSIVTDQLAKDHQYYTLIALINPGEGYSILSQELIEHV